MLVIQGSADQVIARGLTDHWVQVACTTGDVVDYRVYDGNDHVNVLTAAKDDILGWLANRVDGDAARDTCPSP